MSAAKLYQHNGSQYTLGELCRMKYPVANKTTARAILKRLGSVEAFLNYDIIKGEINGKKSGRANGIKKL